MSERDRSAKVDNPEELARRLRRVEEARDPMGLFPPHLLLAADMLEKQARRIHALESQLYDARNDVRALELTYKARQRQGEASATNRVIDAARAELKIWSEHDREPAPWDPDEACDAICGSIERIIAAGAEGIA